MVVTFLLHTILLSALFTSAVTARPLPMPARVAKHAARADSPGVAQALGMAQSLREMASSISASIAAATPTTAVAANPDGDHQKRDISAGLGFGSGQISWHQYEGNPLEYQAGRCGYRAGSLSSSTHLTAIGGFDLVSISYFVRSQTYRSQKLTCVAGLISFSLCAEPASK